jgi:hypothetical protein
MDMVRPWRKPDLRYVPLPMGAAERIVHDDCRKYGTRRCPEAYNNMCATRSGIRFVSVKRWSTDDFSITTWSLCDADYTWREEATLDAEELRALDPENRLPDVLPVFPVVNM